MGDPCLNPGAAMIGGLVDIMAMTLQNGLVDVGFLSGSQVDKFGNINTTVIGDYDHPKSRLPGSGGANPIGSLARKTLIIALHDRPSPGRTSRLRDHARLYSTAPAPGKKWGLPEKHRPGSDHHHTRLSCVSIPKPREAYLGHVPPGLHH